MLVARRDRRATTVVTAEIEDRKRVGPTDDAGARRAASWADNPRRRSFGHNNSSSFWLDAGRAKKVRTAVFSVAQNRLPLLSAEDPQQFGHRVVELIDDAFLQRDDGVVGNRYAFRTNLRTALRNIAVADAVLLFQVLRATLSVQWVHLERRSVDKKTRANELLKHLVLAKHVADVLAEEALNALAELLHPFDVYLRHAPGPVRGVRGPRLERLDAFLHPEIPRHVGDQVADVREGPHGLDRDRFRQVELVEPGHAHQARIAVHFRRAGSTLARLAVPADRQVIG